MGTPKITLNGTDWSNLYHLDYAGGAGGETLATAICEAAGVKLYTPRKKDVPGGFVDSIWNQLIPPVTNNIFDTIINENERYHADVNNHSLERIIKSFIFVKYMWTFIHVGKKEIPEYKLIRLLESDFDFNKIATSWEINDKLFIRTHHDYRNFNGILNNSKRLRIYPLKTALICNYIMFIKQWICEFELAPETLETGVDDYARMYYYKLKKLQNNKVYRWQWEQINKKEEINWKSFVTHFMDRDYLHVLKNEPDHNNIIEAHDFLFKCDEKTIDTINSVTHLNFRYGQFDEFNEVNMKILSDANICLDDITETNVLDNVLNYYIKHNIPVIERMKL